MTLIDYVYHAYGDVTLTELLNYRGMPTNVEVITCKCLTDCYFLDEGISQLDDLKGDQ